MKMVSYVVIGLLAAQAANARPVWPGETWAIKLPEDVGLDAGMLERMSDFMGGRGCVVRRGYLVYSWGNASERGDVASAAKPWYSHFLFRAVEQRKLKCLDEKAARFVPALSDINRDLGYKDRDITFRHLANQTSCYGVKEAPGTAFDYNDWQMALFIDTLFLEVYGATFENVDDRVLHPLLTDVLQCEDGPTFMAFGVDDRPGRVAVSPRDFARFGLLYLREGEWHGRWLLPKKRARMAVTSPLPNTIPRTRAEEAALCSDARSLGSHAIPDDQTDHRGSYSWLWWTNGVDRNGMRQWPHAPSDVFAALGHEHGMRGMAVFPKLDIVMSWNDTRIGDMPEGSNPLDETFRLLCTSANGDRRRLSISPGGHCVAYRGKPLTLVGESGTQCVLQDVNLDYRRWIAECAQAGLNCVHVWSFVAPRQRLDGSVVEPRYGYVYPGITPWARKTHGPRAADGGYQWDLERWDEGRDSSHYWPRLRDLCRCAQEKGLLLGITVFWGWPKHASDWAYHPFNVCNGGPVEDDGEEITQVQRIDAPDTEIWRERWSDAWPPARKCQWLWERFAKKLIDETAAFDNVFFVFMDEHSYSEGNGGNHFLSYFKERGAVWVDWDPRRTGSDMVFADLPYRDDSGKNPGAVEAFLRVPARPLIVLEGGPYRGDAVRYAIWSTLMGGGHYVLHNDAEQETVHTGIMGYDPNVPGGDTGEIRRAWLGHAARFFNEGLICRDALEPANALTGPGAFCLAAPGEDYAVYRMPADGGTIRLDLTDTSGRFRCRRYNPRIGEWHREETREGGGILDFAAPSAEDWALRVSK